MEFWNAAGMEALDLGDNLFLVDGESASSLSGQLQPFPASVEQQQSAVAPTEPSADCDRDPP